MNCQQMSFLDLFLLVKLMCLRVALFLFCLVCVGHRVPSPCASVSVPDGSVKKKFSGETRSRDRSQRASSDPQLKDLCGSHALEQTVGARHAHKTNRTSRG